MTATTSVRQLAWEFRRTILQGTSAGTPDPLYTLFSADEVISAGVRHCGLTVTTLDPKDPLLAGAVAVLDRDVQAIWCSAVRSPEASRFDVAHELAHCVLHPTEPLSAPCTIASEAAEVPPPYGEAYITGYSPAQRKEVDANTFAAELLLPCPLVRTLQQQHVSIGEVADRLGIPQSVLHSQYAYALLIDTPHQPAPHRETEGAHSLQSPLDGLDAWQYAAATALDRPVLVSAGPGTGKTRTLVARALYLIQNGAPPEGILALTFSNRAADEMRRRLAEVAPHAAHRMWIGTFHAFGLEILRRFGKVIGVPPTFRVLDPVDAVALMERHLGRLAVDDFFDLANPFAAAADLLRAIYRAKDEVIAPEDLRNIATNLEGQEDADRVQAIVAAYAQWQRILDEEHVVDFGDLIYRPVQLLRSHPQVRASLRNEYRHILVDEYQDINRASAELVRLIAGQGRGLWAVGDLRQAIYAFRGASEDHIRSFREVYEGAEIKELGVNYRSLPRLVQMFNGLSASMEGIHQGSWSAKRPGEATVVVAVADDEDAQADGIAGAIRAFHEQGIPYQQQAVLCRTNAQADDLAQRLADRGIPIFYLGNLLNRNEIRDLLCLMALAAEQDCIGLLRVASFPEYHIPRAELQPIFVRIAQGTPVVEALAASGSEGARTLGAHLMMLASCHDAYDLLNRYLFQISRYLDGLIEDSSAGARQRRMGIYQLLTLAANEVYRRGAAAPGAFLAHLRRLAATGEDVRARTPCVAESFEAVRILTVHAAKGTEFQCVYVANLAADLFPVKPRNSKPVLPGVELAGPGGPSFHNEEARLFFVAASRARDHLFLCCPRTIRSKGRAVSPLLARSLPGFKHLAQHVLWRAEPSPHLETGPATRAVEISPVTEEIAFHELETYLDCPRRFYYQRLVGGYAMVHPSIASRVRDCVYRALERVYSTVATDQRTAEAIEPIFQEAWNASGLDNHPAAERLRRRAITMTLNAAQIQARPITFKTELDGCTVRILADHVEQKDGCATVERWSIRLGKTKVRPPARYALLRKAARDTLSGASIRLVERDLYSGTAAEIPEPPQGEPFHIERYRKALAGIREASYEAHPTNSTRCPLCPFYFACPA
ncbi:MAG: UvrD-helicase domain-containing protein [Chthonomonadales bacterium]